MKGAYDSWVQLIFLALKSSMIIQAAKRFPLVSPLLAWILLPRKMLQQRAKHIEQTNDKVSRRIARDTDRKDFLQQLTAPGPITLSFQELANNSSTLIVAGSETSATSLAGLTFLLLKNPDKMQKLVQEIRSTFQSDDEITISSVPNLPYLTACLEEGFRMYPPIPSGLPRRVPGAGVNVIGRWVPGGVSTYLPT